MARTEAQRRWAVVNRERYLAQKRAWAKRWREKNKDEKKRRDRALYLANREARIAAQRARDALRDQEHVREIKRKSYDKYRQRDREKRRAKAAAYRKKNPFKTVEHNTKRRLRFLRAEGRFTASDVAKLYVEQMALCAKCRVFLERWHVDHIIPLSRGGSNWPSNLQLLCPPCNLRKHAKIEQ